MSNHLTCQLHQRRSMVLESGKTVHRSDGATCETLYLWAGSNLLTPREVNTKETTTVVLTRVLDSSH